MVKYQSIYCEIRIICTYSFIPFPRQRLLGSALDKRGMDVPSWQPPTHPPSLPSFIYPNTPLYSFLSDVFVMILPAVLLTFQLSSIPSFPAVPQFRSAQIYCHLLALHPSWVPVPRSPMRPSSRVFSGGSSAGCNWWATRTTSDTFSPVGGLLRLGRPSPQVQKGSMDRRQTLSYKDKYSIIQSKIWNI